MHRCFASLLAAGLLVGCTASEVRMSPSSANVQVGRNSPGSEFTQLGPITAKDGGGCGLFGSQGDYQGAMTTLRNKAAAMGADYVQILNQEGEHMTGICLDRSYVIDGFAYKKTD